MLLGHYAVALAAKSYAPRTSLGTLVLAAQLPDLMWPVFILLGWEHVEIVPGLMAASSFDFVRYPISHSLLTTVLWSTVLGAGYYLFRRYGRGAAIIIAAVVSHWFLDAVMHRRDLPLWPGPSIKIGFGLWNSIASTIILEGALFFIGMIIYIRATRPRDGIGTYALLAMLTLLVLIFATGFVTAPPPGEHVIAWAGLGLWLFVPWAAWIDRHREATRRHGIG